jgi:hypothetical protein
MIILGGFPPDTGIVFGAHGITPAQIVTGGNASSPLLNDVDPGDDSTELLWRLEPAYVTAGTTSVTDAGIYQLAGAPDGTYTQPYRLFALPATGAPSTGLANIVTVVGSPVAAPVISGHPLPQTVTDGASATFSVSATGTGLAYQWQRNSVNISGANASTHTFTAVLADTGAQFRAVVSNSGGSVNSNAALLTVNAAAVAPAIASQPQPQNVADGAPATFTVQATGTAPLAYQWRANGANIVGAVSNSYTISEAQQAQNGVVYTVLVSNSVSSVLSAGAALTVQPPVTTAPQIVAQPRSVSVADGSTAVFTVSAIGSSPLAYQWQRGGVNIEGATASQLSVPAVTLADHRAQFRVVVSNGFGSAVSDRVELYVPVVTLAAAKQGARIDDDRFDADIPRWIDAAVRLAEQFCNTYFTPKAPRFERTDWPAAGETFPIGMATSCSATYWDGAAWVALSPAPVVFADGSRTGVAPAAGSTWPALGEVPGGPRVRLVFTAGPASAAALPVEVEHFIIAHVSLWADENRAAAPQAAQNFPWLYAGLEPLKVY